MPKNTFLIVWFFSTTPCDKLNNLASVSLLISGNLNKPKTNYHSLQHVFSVQDTCFALNYWWSPHLSLFQLADIIILDLSLRTFNRKPLYCLLLNGWFRKRTRWANPVFWLATQAGNMHGARTLLARISHYGAARKSSRRNKKKKLATNCKPQKRKREKYRPHLLIWILFRYPNVSDSQV